MQVSIPSGDIQADRSTRGLKIALYAQIAMVMAAIVAMTLAPPREGPMMVIPLGPAAVGQTMGWALPKGAAFLGQGPLPGSILVYARRDVLAASAWQHSSLLIKAPEIFCGKIAGTQGKKQTSWN